MFAGIQGRVRQRLWALEQTQKLKLFGEFPLGNREFIFNAEGQEAGAGVALTDLPDPDGHSLT